MNASSNLLSDAPQRTVGGSIEQRCVWCGEWTESGFLSDEGVCDECSAGIWWGNLWIRPGMFYAEQEESN